MEKKIGVYICACGGNISDYVDIEKVKEAVKDDGGVLLAKTTMFACGDSNQNEMVADIQNNNLNGIVVASCSPKLHLTTFRGVSERAGLNKYNYVHANIREQSSWAHSDNKIGATEKAIRLVKAAIAKARSSASLDPVIIESERAVAVIGAGVAGMKAAISLADMNDRVYLVEKESEPGGHISKIGIISPENVTGKEVAERLISEVKERKNISLYTGSKVVEKTGNIGDFRLTIENGTGEKTEIKAGSVLVATGFESYIPAEGEYGYGQIPNVITLPEFKELLSLADGKSLKFNGRKVNTIAFIYCIGSREVKGEKKYCSRFCCTAAIQTSNDIKAKFPDIDCIHFHKGIRSYGKQELIYKKSRENGDLYIQFPDKEIPSVVSAHEGLIVRSKDILSAKGEISADADIVVLVTGMVPHNEDNTGSLFKLPKGRDSFFNEIHMKLRPVETVTDGITIAGTCQGPKNVFESVNSALAAAAKSHSFISKGELALEPIIAIVDSDTCTWCGKCAEACPYGAIEILESIKGPVATVINSTCKGCGMCLPVCPSDSVELKTFSNKEIEDMIDVLAG
jgi:heterodisulfide reductase subunit A